MERYILRDEVFGVTVYDRKTLRYKLVSESELKSGISFNGQEVESCEHWIGDLSSAPRDLLYSPVRVYFEATKMCNLRCPICFNSSGKRDPNEMSTKEIFWTLEGLRRDNIFDVRFTGGEFTLLPDGIDILRHAKELGFAVSLNTNGVCKDKTIIDNLAELDLSQITVSIDGIRENHDLIRGKGNYDRSVEFLKLLHERGAVLRSNTVLTEVNTRDMASIIEAVGRYVSEMNFFHMRQVGRAQGMEKQAVTYQELAGFNDRAAKIAANYPHVNIMFGSLVTRQNSIMVNDYGLRVGGPDGLVRFNLLPDGSMCAGGYAPYINSELKLGNIKEDGYTVLKVWRNSQKLNAFRDFTGKLVRKCMGCPELGAFCGGANAEMELLKLNSMLDNNPYCIYG